MHELSIVQALFEQVEKLAAQHQARRVVRLAVEVGEFSNVVPELFERAFDAFCQVEPLLAGARMEVRVLPLRLHCEECRGEFRPQNYSFLCPHCSSSNCRVIQGEELLLRDLELEIDEDKDIGNG